MADVTAQPLRITLAGTCRIGALDNAGRLVPTRQARMVLARLALSSGSVTRDGLAEMLWPKRPPPSGMRNVSVVISRLRALLASVSKDGAAAIASSSGAYGLVLPSGSQVDVLEAADLVDVAREYLRAGRLDAAAVAARAAADVARRPFVPGASAMWFDERRAWLREVLVRALSVEVEVAIRLRDPAGTSAARLALDTEPTSVHAYADAMRLSATVGDPGTVLAVYQRYRRVIVDELGLPPVAAIEGLRARILDPADGRAGDVAAVAAKPPSSAGHGAVIGVGTSFIGRTEELDVLRDAVVRARLVTLVGPAGVGKSRLAREAACRMAPGFPDAVRECRLAQVAHPAGVIPAVAAVVGAMPQAGRTLADSVLDALGSRRMLLLLDNCEHLLPAVARLAERILATCSDIRLLATSRERIGIDGESVHPVEPLPVPPPDADLAAVWADPPAALQLLRDRIQAVRPRAYYGPVDQAALTLICRRLDGLPLAIELAAARCGGMTPSEMAERLERRLAMLTQGRRTAPPRHRTLRAAIGWSYELLDAPQRRVLERCCVFSGGFTLTAAEQVCDAGLGRDQVTDAVGLLVDKSLLVLDDRVDGGRYDMLETLREFAREQLVAHGDEDRTEKRHAEYFAALARQGDALVRGPAEAEGVALFRREMSNLRGAHAWARRAGRQDLTSSLSAAVGWFAFFRMQTDLLAWAEHIPEVPGPHAGPAFVEALATAGRGAWMRGDLDRAEALAEQARTVAGEDARARHGWHLMANVALFRGDLGRAAHGYLRAEVLAEAVEDRFHTALLRGCRALVCSYAGDSETALTLAEDASIAAEGVANPSALAWTLYVLGEVLAATDPGRALSQLERADAVAATVGAEFVRGVAGLTAASLHGRYGEPTAAALALAALLDRWVRGGNRRQLWTTMREVAAVLVRLERWGAAAVVLAAIERSDAEHLWGSDAERLARLGEQLAARLGPLPVEQARVGRHMDLSELIAFVRRELRGACRSSAANIPQTGPPTVPGAG